MFPTGIHDTDHQSSTIGQCGFLLVLCGSGFQKRQTHILIPVFVFVPVFGQSPMATNLDNWTPGSWQQKVVLQQPTYPDPEQLQEALQKLAKLPPLVTSWEIESLKQQLADAAQGKTFLLQAGDCSESLDDCDNDSIVRNLKVLMQMLSLIHI